MAQDAWNPVPGQQEDPWQAPPAAHDPRYGNQAQQPYGMPATTMTRPTRSTRGLAIALSILVPIAVIGAILDAAFEKTEVTYEDGNVEAQRTGWTAFGGLAGIAAAVIGLVWAYRVAANARDLPGPAGPSPGWAVGAWFIPIAHMLAPVFPLATARRKMAAGSPGLFAAWWAMWALGLAITYVTLIWGMSLAFAEGKDAAAGEQITVSLPAAFVATSWVGTLAYSISGALFLAVVWAFVSAEQKLRPA